MLRRLVDCGLILFRSPRWHHPIKKRAGVIEQLTGRGPMFVPHDLPTRRVCCVSVDAGSHQRGVVAYPPVEVEAVQHHWPLIRQVKLGCGWSPSFSQPGGVVATTLEPASRGLGDMRGPDFGDDVGDAAHLRWPAGNPHAAAAEVQHMYMVVGEARIHNGAFQVHDFGTAR